MSSASSPHDDRARRITTWVALACIILSGIVFIRRGAAAWVAASIAPGTTVTSGSEGESLFALWRAMNGQPVYTDTTRLPYSAAYFNWLFYAAYAKPVKLAVSIHGNAFIAKTGRLITAAGGLLGAAVLGWLLWRTRRESATMAAAIATFVFFGPLVGWWAHTVRPDVWALTLETAALAVLLCHYRSRPLTAALLSGLLFYGAWSFKQTYFLGLGIAILFLLLRRQWPPALLLATLSGALWAATFALLGPVYRTAFLNTGTAAVFHFTNGWTNLTDMLVKTFPLWLLALISLGRPPEAHPASTLAGDLRRLGWLGLLIALPLTFAASCKVGAHSNYYFTIIVMLAFVTIGAGSVKGTGWLVAASFAAALVLQILIVAGRFGKIDLTLQARKHAESWMVWQKEPEPRFAAINNFNLPWLNPASPPLVLAFNYWQERQTRHDFEAGGVGGLITAGYFRSLLLPMATGDAYDGGSLSLYRREETINGLTIFRRQPAAATLK